MTCLGWLISLTTLTKFDKFNLPEFLPAQGRLYDIFEMFRRLDLSMFFSQITLTITVGVPPPPCMRVPVCPPSLLTALPPSHHHHCRAVQCVLSSCGRWFAFMRGHV